MCLAEKNPETEPPSKEVQSPRSPWMKLLNRQSSKPRLPRREVTSTRVNLNKCWSKLGELISNSPASPDLPSHKTADEPLVIAFSEYFYPLDPVKPVPVEDDDNATNQNILNSTRFELLPGQEVSDNMANEVREICYEINRSCFVCNLCC